MKVDINKYKLIDNGDIFYIAYKATGAFLFKFNNKKELEDFVHIVFQKEVKQII